MRIDHRGVRDVFARQQAGKASDHSVEDRLYPRRTQYDWLLLSALADDVRSVITTAAASRQRAGAASGAEQVPLALDVGSFRCPYRKELEGAGYRVLTLDLSRESGADLVGTAESTGLDDHSVDLLLCTQVLEHTTTPWRALEEFARIVRPGGGLVVSVPHVWFYHPHPGDYWRFTQEGLVSLCDRYGFDVLELHLQRGSVAAAAQIVNFMLYGLLGRAGAPLYWLLNSVGAFGDRVLPNPLFSLNVTCLARRRDR